MPAVTLYNTDGCSHGVNWNIHTALPADYEKDIPWNCSGCFGGTFERTTKDPYRCEAGNFCGEIKDAERENLKTVNSSCQLTGDLDCSDRIPREYCRVVSSTTALCVACREDTHCDQTSPNKYCDPYGACEVCTANAHCPDTAMPFCVRARSSSIPAACVECTQSTHCSGGTPYCISNVCGECRNLADCPASRPYCLRNIRSCVECRNDSHCSSGEKCSNDKRCVPAGSCTRHSQCSEGGLTTGGSDGEYCTACDKLNNCSGTGVCQSCTWGTNWCPTDKNDVKRSCYTGTNPNRDTKRIGRVEDCRADDKECVSGVCVAGCNADPCAESCRTYGNWSDCNNTHTHSSYAAGHTHSDGVGGFHQHRWYTCYGQTNKQWQAQTCTP